MQKSKWSAGSYLLLMIIVLAVLLRLFKLQEIPAEIWGDIVEGYKFTAEIILGRWPFYFVLGNGPLFFYLASFISFITDSLSFTSLKITSNLVGLLLIIGTYLFCKELLNKKTALIAAFLLAVSKWSLIFSRLANMNILVPAFISFIFYFLIRAIKRGKTVDFALTGFITGLGLYNYPAFLATPFSLILIIFCLWFFDRKKIEKNIKKITISIVIFLILSIPFIKMFSQFGFNKKSSYFGSKILFSSEKPSDGVVSRFMNNTISSLSMFHIRGDGIFRVNANSEPHLDIISGAFLLVGILYIFARKHLRKNIIYLLIPFFVLQLPAILVLSFPHEVPSATRSIGMLPFLYILIAIGIYYFWKDIASNQVRLFIIIILILIPYYNLRSVFIAYPKGLPNSNVPFGKIIAERIDKLPKDTAVYINGCCWGDWGQPEPNGIRFALRSKRKLNFFQADSNLEKFECKIVKKTRKMFFIVNPRWLEEMEKIKKCFSGGEEKLITKNGFDIAWSYKLN